MILRELELSNIRSHEHSVIEFNEGITVLTGRTGCGKSSILMSVIYSLFGASVNLQNSSLLRRGVKNGFVRLRFSHAGVDYEVMRGMKRSGSRIIVDSDNLWLKREGQRLPLIARTNELNDKLIELLGYPSDVNPLDLFEVTSYAKQDEVRKLIELGGAERERYIDRVLGLSKYELTYQHLRLLLNELKQESGIIKGRLERLGRVKELIKIKEELINELRVKSGELKSKLELSEESLSELESKRASLKSELSELQARKEAYDKRKGLLEGVKSELKELRDSLPSEVPGECELDSLLERKSKLIGERARLRGKIKDLRGELDSVSELGGECPLCKQSITESHVQRVSDELSERIKLLSDELSDLSEELVNNEDAVKEARVVNDLLDSVRVKEERVSELVEREDSLMSELVEFKQVSELESLKNDFELINDSFVQASSSHASLSQEFSDLGSNLEQQSSELESLKGELRELESEAESLEELESKVELLTKLRVDIRSISGLIRTRFLEDFRHEFQAKFEQLRPCDYSVEVGLDYEPLMFAQGGEVSVDSLSGGERTSVGLAYRLALSEIAARVSSVERNELLLLDEPTTGFDQEDLNSLPNTLRNITIPQIIIVSHADELKEAADNLHELRKENNQTIIN